LRPGLPRRIIADDPMNRRPLWIIVVGAVLLGAGLLALSGAFSPTTAPTAPSGSAQPTGSPSGSAAAVATASGAAPATSATPGPSAAGPAATPAATCVQVAQLVAVRASDPATGFPVKVAWTNLGPAGDLFLTLSDVAPTIPITPAGPAALTVGLGYMTGGDRFALTAGSLTLVYDPATGAVTGDVATGYGKNSNRATTDAQPSQLVATLVRPAGGANGSLTGTISHAGRRDYQFTVEMAEKTIQVGSGPGCPSARPTDAL
jgi:hypothetical protein